MYKSIFAIFSVLLSFLVKAQPEQEIAPPFNIKTATFVQGNQNVIPIFQLGDQFTFLLTIYLVTKLIIIIL